MEKHVLVFNPDTGKPEAVMPLSELLATDVKPFASLWRDTTLKQFTQDTIQPLLNHTENASAVFAGGFVLQDSNTIAKVPLAGIYKTTMRTQMTKNDAGDDVGTTATQLLVNNESVMGQAVNWALFADGTSPGDDDNQPNDKTKVQFLKLSEGSLLSLKIGNTLGNDVYGMQVSLEWIAPLDTPLVG